MPDREWNAMSARTQPQLDVTGAEGQLRAFIRKFGTNDQRLIRAVRSAVRRRLPTPNELVWDNYNFFVTAAISRAAKPLAASGRGKLIIRSISAKQRPRQRPSKRPVSRAGRC